MVNGIINTATYDKKLLETYYGLTSEPTETTEEALEALKNGNPVIGYEQGHILAFVPVNEEEKQQGYLLRVLDSKRGHDGIYKSIEEVNSVVDGEVHFLGIIKEM